MRVGHYTSLALALNRLIGQFRHICILRVFRVFKSLVESVHMSRRVVKDDLKTVPSRVVSFDHIDQGGHVGLDLEKCEEYAFGAFNNRIRRFSFALVFW